MSKKLFRSQIAFQAGLAPEHHGKEHGLLTVNRNGSYELLEMLTAVELKASGVRE